MCTIEEGLKNVSWHDKACMRKFFDFAIKSDNAAHVLCFENKPVCFTVIVVKDNRRSFSEILCLKGWRAFKKNEHLFPHPNFIFCEELYDQDGCKILDIYIINKLAIYKCLRTHSHIFTNALGEEFSPDWFIGKLEQGETLPALIHHNDFLLGILLGYGDESSKAYQDAKPMDDSIPEWTETYTGIDAPRPQNCTISPISFMGNPNSHKTQQLLKVYEKELQTIWIEYQQKNDPLLFFLEHLSPCAEKPDDHPLIELVRVPYKLTLYNQLSNGSTSLPFMPVSACHYQLNYLTI